MHISVTFNFKPQQIQTAYVAFKYLIQINKMADLWTLLSILPTTFPICDFSLDLTLLGSHASLLSVLPPVFWIRHKTNTNAFPYVEYLCIDT